MLISIAAVAARATIAAAVGASTYRLEIDGPRRHVRYGPQHVRMAFMARYDHADDFGVDPRHLVKVDDGLDPGHMHDALDALDELVAPHVAITMEVLMLVDGVAVVFGRDRPTTPGLAVAITGLTIAAGACGGRSADESPPDDQCSRQGCYELQHVTPLLLMNTQERSNLC